MRFRCTRCEAIFYRDEPPKACSLCGGEVREDPWEKQERRLCEHRGSEVELRLGIPICEYFLLNNAPGARCRYFAFPRRCDVARLPEYQPRLGLVQK